MRTAVICFALVVGCGQGQLTPTTNNNDPQHTPSLCTEAGGYECTSVADCPENLPGSFDSTVCCEVPCSGTVSGQTCGAQGGVICANQANCGGTFLDASDSERCCDQACDTTPDATCAGQGGHVCNSNETCAGGAIAASDTTRCCDIPCVSGPTQCDGSLSCLKIAPPPGGGMIMGKYEWESGDRSSFEQAIGRRSAFAWGVDWPMVSGEGAHPQFSAAIAQQAWDAGYVTMVGAYEATPEPGIAPPGWTVDRLIRGDYDSHLTALASEFRQFGKPMFFETIREPNGITASYMGGFGANGDQSFNWAIANEKGLAEFDPSSASDPSLFADLGDPLVCDGLERLIAAQRYYYDFFVNREGLSFLTFDSFGWAAYPPFDPSDEPVSTPHEGLLRASCSNFANAYPGDAWVDWVSINWYLGGQQIDYFVGNLRSVLQTVRTVAPNKPILLTEFGFAAGGDPNSQANADAATAALTEVLSHPEIRAFGLWSSTEDDGGIACIDIVPGTAAAVAFRDIVDANPSSFHGCAYLSDGSTIPGCVP